MQAEEQRLLNLGIKLGITLRTQCQGNEIEICFEQWHNSVVFREEAFGVQAHTGTHQHNMNFDDEAVIESWMKVSRQFLDELGVQYTIDHHRMSRCFHIVDMRAHAVFVQHADDGYFDRAANQYRAGLAQQYERTVEQVVHKYRVAQENLVYG